MFCRNCGKEIVENAKFCSFCGESTGTSSNVIAKTVSKGLINFDKETVLHYLSMITSAIIILLTFSKWIRIESWIISSDISTLGLLKRIDALSKYGDTKALTGFAIIYIFLMVVIITLAIQYILKAYKTGLNTCDNGHIVYGYPAMLAVAIVCGLFVVLSLIIFSSNEYDAINMHFNEKAYYIIGLACLNRFVLLPRLNEIIYYRKERNNINDHNNDFK